MFTYVNMLHNNFLLGTIKKVIFNFHLFIYKLLKM
jgi:hypothetical protein